MRVGSVHYGRDCARTLDFLRSVHLVHVSECFLESFICLVTKDPLCNLGLEDIISLHTPILCFSSVIRPTVAVYEFSQLCINLNITLGWPVVFQRIFFSRACVDSTAKGHHTPCFLSKIYWLMERLFLHFSREVTQWMYHNFIKSLLLFPMTWSHIYFSSGNFLVLSRCLGFFANTVNSLVSRHLRALKNVSVSRAVRLRELFP